MTTHRRIDFSLIAIALLLALQASIASYGLRLVRDVAAGTHEKLVEVARAGR